MGRVLMVTQQVQRVAGCHGITLRSGTGIDSLSNFLAGLTDGVRVSGDRFFQLADFVVAKRRTGNKQLTHIDWIRNHHWRRTSTQKRISQLTGESKTSRCAPNWSANEIVKTVPQKIVPTTTKGPHIKTWHLSPDGNFAG